MKILVMAASARKDSLNKKLAALAAHAARTAGHTVDAPDFREFTMPVYDGDLEAAQGVPAAGKNFAARLLAADAIVFSTPEYNGGIPGAFKNAVDWASRTTPNPLSGKPVLLLGASPGGFGGIRGLWHTRVPLEALGALVHPDMLSLPQAGQAFAVDGTLTDPKVQARLERLLATFLSHALAIAGAHKST